MKRWVYSKTNIYSMSVPRSKAKERIEALGEIVLEHVCKCVLYGDSTGDYHHWVDGEIANWLSIANDLTIKPSNKKLKARDYDEMLLGGFGDDLADARMNLNLLYRKFRQSANPYPEVNLTPDLVKKLADVTAALHDILPKLLSQQNNMTQDDLAAELHTILDKYCL